MHDFIRKITQFITKHQMIFHGDKVLVGVSGGPDSMAMLYALYQLRSKLGFSIHIAHLDHQFRGEESKADADFVKQHAHLLNLPITLELQDVPRLVERENLSLEAGARKVRYEFYQRVVEKERCDSVALGHNADDQAETVLMHLIRGSGMRGLVGMLPVRGIYIRPLLNVFRAEIDEFTSDIGIVPRQDSSNIEPIYFRNKIRLELLPFLESNYNPNIKKILLQTAEILRAEMELLDRLCIDKTSDCVVSISEDEVHLCLDSVKAQPVAIQRGMLRRAVGEIIKIDGIVDIDFDHIEAILEMIDRKSPNLSLKLPHQIEAVKTYHQLVIRKQIPKDKIEFDYELKVPGETKIPELSARVITKFDDDYPSDDRYKEVIDYEKIKLPLRLRNRRDGDRFQPLGMKGTKKLKDFLIDLKVPLKQRDRIPLLTSGEQIVWVIGYRLDDRYKITDQTKNKLVASFVTANGRE